MATYSEFGRCLSSPAPGEEVVITGISGRLPESRNVKEFQDNILAKKDLVTDDDRRWKLTNFEIPRRSSKIHDIEKMDAGHFGLHYRQANIMDPQMRKFLETAEEAIMDAGLNPSELQSSRTGVFVGTCYADVETITFKQVEDSQSFAVTGFLRSFIAHRVSYYLKLKGPSCVVDSACSSSMNAMELALKFIRMGKCDSALVGGANLLMHPSLTRQFFQMGALSPDGTCRVFDQDAKGYVRGETVACVFLQKAKDAKRIYAQVLYGKVNHDGFKSQGITYPSSHMQQKLITEVFQDSGIDPSELSFLEAHGTGTIVGDPQEVEAIDRAVAQKRNEPLLIGSIKCSVGHSEPASGLCSVIKMIIAMETGIIPPNIHLKNIKKGLEGLEEGRLIAVTDKTELKDGIVGLNNFGFGGNNCHLLLKPLGQRKTELPEDGLPRLVCVSGRTKEAVLELLDSSKQNDREYIGLLHEIFKRKVNGHLYRGFGIVSKEHNLKSSVQLFVRKESNLHLYFGDFKNGYKILEPYFMEFPCFKKTIKQINTFLKKQKGFNQNEISHDALQAFVLQMGIIEIIKLLGLTPTVVYGDSFGKIIAAYYYGNITLEDALEIVSEYTKLGRKSDKFFENGFNREEFFTELDVTKNSIVLNISDKLLTNGDVLTFSKNSNFVFLEVLGRLYQAGYDFEIQKLYPEVKFPVSRGTQMISSSLKWNYKKNWHVYKYAEFQSIDVTQKEYNLSTNIYHSEKFLLGHVIDGRNLVPAIHYLQLVWKTYAQSFNMATADLPVVFEDCRFVRAITLPKNGYVNVLVTIEKGSGKFQVVEKDSLIVSGRISMPTNKDVHLTDLPKNEWDENDRARVLEQDEIYRELYLRGYNYTGLFKGLLKCNSHASVGLMRWERNWTAFIDKMLQLKMLEVDTRLLYVPIGIEKLAIDPILHLKFVEEQEDSLCTVYNYKDSNVIKCGGIELRGIKASSISKRKPPVDPVLEKYVFVPNQTRMTLEESLRVNAQIILEDSLENNFKAVEIIDDATRGTELLLPLVSKALDDLPLVVLNLIVSTKMDLKEIPGVTVENVILTSTSNLLLVIATNPFRRLNVLNMTLSALSPKGFLLTREEIDFCPQIEDNIEILVEHVVNNEKLILFRKVQQPPQTKYIEISSNEFNWIPQLQQALKSEKEVLVYSQNRGPEGIVGFVNCIRREPEGHKVRCFFMMDQAPKFDPKNQFYSNQLRKKLPINIYKNGTWGTYRHLPLDGEKEVESEHFFLNTVVRGDLSTLKWFEGSLHSKSRVNKDHGLVYPFYTSINFKDIMVASGRVNIDAITKDRIEQEALLGFECAGIDSNGRRVVAFGNMAMSTIFSCSFACEIPNHWSLEDGATVAAVYLTVLYALHRIIKIRPGKSILIHSATGGIGLAAINVCFYYGYEMFVTVGTQEKRDYIKKHFPQIPESHIGNSRDNSFEEMIKTETRSRGVDVVLNSLSEEKLRASIRCVAPGGDFLEIGKFDLGNDSSLKLLLLEKNVNFHGVMLDKIVGIYEEETIWLLQEFTKGIELGYIKPLPRTVFQRDEVEKAFRYMMTGKHMGKVLIKVRDENQISAPIGQVFRGSPRFSCDPEKSYIIIGGLGGFGLELADWLYLRGAKKLVLVSRTGVQSGYQFQRIEIWRSSGVAVAISTEDVTTHAGSMALIKNATNLGPLDAIFNLAVLLKDNLFEDQTFETFSISLAPKAQATLFLDQITREHCPELRYFVVFSSVSCGRGNIGQTNYGMANSIMERICEKRKNDGLPALAIQWGAIGDVGLVAKMQKENRELVIGGTFQQKISNCLQVLDKFLKQDCPIVSSMVVAEKNTKSYKTGGAVDAVAYALGVKDIKTVSHETAFAEFGMDSMTTTEMIQLLKTEYEIFLTASDVRTMTFAKLIDLERQLNEEDKGTKSDAMITGTFLQYLPSSESNGLSIVKIPGMVQSDEEVTTAFVLPGIEGGLKPLESFIKNQYLPSSESNGLSIVKIPGMVQSDKEVTTVFVLPGIEGGLKPLESFIKNLKAQVFGFQYSLDNPRDSIEEVADIFEPLIQEKLTEHSPFFIIGYSFGTIVATEIIARLESIGHRGKFVAIDGSPKYLTTGLKQAAPGEEEDFEIALVLQLLSFLVPSDLLLSKKEQFMKCKSLDERANLATTILPGDDVIKEVRKKALVALVKRCKSVFKYKFNHKKIESAVHLIKAKYPVVRNINNDYDFSELCEGPVQIDTVDGDHSIILKQNRLIELVNSLLDSL